MPAMQGGRMPAPHQQFPMQSQRGFGQASAIPPAYAGAQPAWSQAGSPFPGAQAFGSQLATPQASPQAQSRSPLTSPVAASRSAMNQNPVLPAGWEQRGLQAAQQAQAVPASPIPVGPSSGSLPQMVDPERATLRSSYFGADGALTGANTQLPSPGPLLRRSSGSTIPSPELATGPYAATSSGSTVKPPEQPSMGFRVAPPPQPGPSTGFLVAAPQQPGSWPNMVQRRVSHEHVIYEVPRQPHVSSMVRSSSSPQAAVDLTDREVLTTSKSDSNFAARGGVSRSVSSPLAQTKRTPPASPLTASRTIHARRDGQAGIYCNMPGKRELWNPGSLLQKATARTQEKTARILVDDKMGLAFSRPAYRSQSKVMDVEQRGLIERSLAALVGDVVTNGAFATRTDEPPQDVSFTLCATDEVEAVPVDGRIETGLLTASALAAMEPISMDMPRVVEATDSMTPTTETAWLYPDGDMQEAAGVSLKNLGDLDEYMPHQSSGQMWTFAVEDVTHALQQAAMRAKRTNRQLIGQRQQAEAKNKKMEKGARRAAEPSSDQVVAASDVWDRLYYGITPPSPAAEFFVADETEVEPVFNDGDVGVELNSSRILITRDTATQALWPGCGDLIVDAELEEPQPQSTPQRAAAVLPQNAAAGLLQRHGASSGGDIMIDAQVEESQPQLPSQRRVLWVGDSIAEPDVGEPQPLPRPERTAGVISQNAATVQVGEPKPQTSPERRISQDAATGMLSRHYALNGF